MPATAAPPGEEIEQVALSAHAELADLAVLAGSGRRRRTIREWAEQEVWLPRDSRAGGMLYDVNYQPFARLYLEALDSGRWREHAASGPSQCGKTLTCFTIPVLYHLFELAETVIIGVPDMDMAADKWRRDLLPIIRASRYASLLPTSGSGSRGGQVTAIEFGNGASLRFMSGGGSDKRRAGYTARILAVTETDGLDEAGMASREADKISQMQARRFSYGERRRGYYECTVSTSTGYIWRTLREGSTNSRAALPCPHCGEYVSPEREHFRGWEDAASEIEARRLTHVHCPACGEPWTEEQRAAANRAGVLAHGEQTVDRHGRVQGEEPETETFGFRWTAANNLFLSAGDVGIEEWNARRAADEENAERRLRQFVHCLPCDPPVEELEVLDYRNLARRVDRTARGICRADVEHITAGVDVGKWLLHWTVVAWSAGGGGTVVDYGAMDVASRSLPEDEAIHAALGQLQDYLDDGYAMEEEGAVTRVPVDLVVVDAGYSAEAVYRFCGPRLPRWIPAQGAGDQFRMPRARSKSVVRIGENYYVQRTASPLCKIRLEFSAGYWRGWLQTRLGCDVEEPGALRLYGAEAIEHYTFGRHLTAERRVEEFIPRRGTVIRWEVLSRQNHWLDATVMASMAGHMAGARAAPPKREAKAKGETKTNFRPFLATER